MLILGLLVLAASAAFTVLLIADNLSGMPDYQVSVLGNDIATVDTLAAFCAGLALALLFCLGAWLVAQAGKRHRRRGSSRLPEKRGSTTGSSVDDDVLAEQLARERGGHRRTSGQHRH